MTKGLTEEQKKNLVNNWIGSLRYRFGGLDFWRLSKQWKEIHYRQFAELIVNEMDWVIQHNNDPDLQ